MAERMLTNASMRAVLTIHRQLKEVDASLSDKVDYESAKDSSQLILKGGLSFTLITGVSGGTTIAIGPDAVVALNSDDESKLLMTVWAANTHNPTVYTIWSDGRVYVRDGT